MVARKGRPAFFPQLGIEVRVADLLADLEQALAAV